jgi:hypothetical protein
MLLPLLGRPQGSPCPSPPTLPRRQCLRRAIARPTRVRSPCSSLQTTRPRRQPHRPIPPCCRGSRTTLQASLRPLVLEAQEPLPVWSVESFAFCFVGSLLELLRQARKGQQTRATRISRRCITLGIGGVLDFVHCLELQVQQAEWLRLALSKGPKRVGVSSSPHLRTETSSVSETLCFLVFRIPDDGQSPETQWFWDQDKLDFLILFFIFYFIKGNSSQCINSMGVCPLVTSEWLTDSEWKCVRTSCYWRSRSCSELLLWTPAKAWGKSEASRSQTLGLGLVILEKYECLR